MSTFNQITRAALPGAELTFKNYGVTDIAANTGVLFDGTNKGDANNPPGIVGVTTSGGVVKTAGVTLETIKAGGTGRVVVAGGAVGTANATLNPGDLVELDDTSGHEGQVKAAASTHETLGKALSAAVAGDPIHVWVNVTGHN